MINVGVIGLGIGRRHLEVYREHPAATIRGVQRLQTPKGA